jgi:hypothetical protein
LVFFLKLQLKQTTSDTTTVMTEAMLYNEAATKLFKMTASAYKLLSKPEKLAKYQEIFESDQLYNFEILVKNGDKMYQSWTVNKLELA